MLVFSTKTRIQLTTDRLVHGWLDSKLHVNPHTLLFWDFISSEPTSRIGLAQPGGRAQRENHQFLTSKWSWNMIDTEPQGETCGYIYIYTHIYIYMDLKAWCVKEILSILSLWVELDSEMNLLVRRLFWNLLACWNLEESGNSGTCSEGYLPSGWLTLKKGFWPETLKLPWIRNCYHYSTS